VAGDKEGDEEGSKGNGNGDNTGNGNNSKVAGDEMARAARTIAAAMRMVGDKEGNSEGGKVMAIATRVAGDKEGSGKGGKGNGNNNKGVRQGTAMATKRAMATATRVVGKEEGDSNKEGNCNSSEGGRQQRG
jgi:hypothetical protein